MDFRQEGVAEACYRTCPAFNFPAVENAIATARHDAEEMAEIDFAGAIQNVASGADLSPEALVAVHHVAAAAAEMATAGAEKRQKDAEETAQQVLRRYRKSLAATGRVACGAWRLEVDANDMSTVKQTLGSTVECCQTPQVTYHIIQLARSKQSEGGTEIRTYTTPDA